MNRRSTASQKKVLNVIKSLDCAVSQEMISSEVPKINRATVYRILNRFCEDGILHKIVDEAGIQYYALCKFCDKVEHHHDHLHFKCLTCQKVECITSELKFQLPKNYLVKNFNAMLSGTCENCQMG